MKSIVFILFPVFLLAQEFMIQPNGSEPVVDPFTGDIYCRVFGEGIVKIRADGSGKVVNPFPHQELPVFANKEHKAFYSIEIENDSMDIYLVDLEQDTIFILTKSKIGVVEGVSPNDKYLFIDGETAQYYSFEKDTVIDTGIKLYRYFDPALDWINDSTIVYINDQNKIIRFCFTQGILDTLVKLKSAGEYLFSLSVNPIKKIIAYSTLGSIPKIVFRFMENNQDSVFYSTEWDSSYATVWGRSEVEWNASYNKLAFIIDIFEVAGGDIFVFDYERKKTLRYTEDHYGDKINLSWLGDSDTLIYENVHYGAVMGFALNEPVSEIPVGIEQNRENPPIITNIRLIAYPNPFNSATTIEIRNAPAERLKLSIYDVNGRLVYERIVNASPGTGVTFLWDRKGTNNIPLASGIYYLIVSHSTSRPTLKIKPYKLVLMK